MDRHVLRQDLSFCEVGGRLVFLDVGNDQYLRLPPALETAFVRYFSTDPPPDIDVSGLVARNILVAQKPGAKEERSTAVPPTRSAMEEASPAPRVTALQALEVLLLVIHTRLLMKFRPFKETLRIVDRPQATSGTPTLAKRCVIEDAAIFRRIRLYVPVGMRCLVDSVALSRFLRRRKHRVHVVFGVAVDPFSAHCWVQADNVVLNDTLGNVTSHTPIRVV